MCNLLSSGSWPQPCQSCRSMDFTHLLLSFSQLSPPPWPWWSKYIRTCKIIDNGEYFNRLPMPPRLDRIHTINVDSLHTYFLKSTYLIFFNNLTLVFDNIIYYRQLYMLIRPILHISIACPCPQDQPIFKIFMLILFGFIIWKMSILFSTVI